MSVVPIFSIASNIYLPLLILLASRIPLDSSTPHTFGAWRIGLYLAALSFIPIGIAVYIFSAMAGATGNAGDISSAFNSMLPIAAIFLLIGFSPFLLAIGTRFLDNTMSGRIQASEGRHWVYFAIIFSVLYLIPRAIFLFF